MINISTIKNVSHIKKCPRGTIVTGDGIGNILFVILKGEIGVYTNYRQPNAEIISTLGVGDLFADPGLLTDKKASYATVSLSDTVIMSVEKTALTDFLKEEPELVFELLKDLFLRLDNANQSNRSLLIQYGDKSKQVQDKKEPKLDLTAVSKPETPINSDKAVTPAPIISSMEQRRDFMLFPSEHGTYKLPLEEHNLGALMNKSHVCPICKTGFDALTVRPSKLSVTSTDSDLRYHYKGIEPIYYEVLTCPNCLYSALPDVFGEPDKSKPDILHGLEPLKSSVGDLFTSDKSTESIFAGFYLALHTAPISYIKYQMVAGKLLYKLSRVYQDVGDEALASSTAKRALDNYLYAYSNVGTSPSQEQQICVLIGELYLKQNDLKNAVSFLSKAKSCPGSSPVLKNHADNRIYEIRSMAANQKQS